MKTPPFPDVTVLLGDPRLPDVTKVDNVFSEEDLEIVRRLQAALGELEGYRFEYVNEHKGLVSRFTQHPPQFVLNLCDTGFLNRARYELHIPALLELLGVPYSGATPACMVLGYDKALVRMAAASVGVPVPDELFIRAGESFTRPAFGYPALLKPNTADGSLGITRDAVVNNEDEARRYFGQLQRNWPDRDILVQEFLSGTEYGIALLGNGNDLKALPPMEVDYSGLDPSLPHLLGYESKTLPDSPYWSDIRYRRADSLNPGQLAELTGWCSRLFHRFECRDYMRFDFRADAAGAIKFLEINPNPAWSWDGKLNFMAEFAGLSYSQILGRLLGIAQARSASPA